MVCSFMLKMTKATPAVAAADAAAAPAAGANMTDGESVALDAATDQLASLSVSKETEADESESTTRPKDKVDDPDLWKPGPPPEDCPVCMVPLPIEFDASSYFACCGNAICSACNEESTRAHNIINSKRAKKELPPLEESCPFCRTPYCDGDDYVKRILLQTKKDDCEALFSLATKYHDGIDGLPRDESKALELLIRAAELGSTKAMACLGRVYESGDLGTKKDMEKSRECFERAAIRGSFGARCCLAENELENNNHDLAIRHYRLAAEGGYSFAMKILWDIFYQGELSKGDLEKTLRAHQTAVDERKSEDRERYLAMKKAEEDGDEQLTNLYLQYYQGHITLKELNKTLKAYKSMS